MIKAKRKTKRGQALLRLSLCLKRYSMFYKEYFSKKNPIAESPCRFPLSPSVFNSRLSLSRTGLAGHPHQVLCPDSYPPKWPDVWHTFLVAKGVDNSTCGSKMTKIELTPKCCWTQPLFYSSAFFNSPWTESLWKSFAIYKLFCKCKASFKKKKTQCGVRCHDTDSDNTQLTHRGTVFSTENFTR